VVGGLAWVISGDLREQRRRQERQRRERVEWSVKPPRLRHRGPPPSRTIAQWPGAIHGPSVDSRIGLPADRSNGSIGEAARETATA
jgi:hypothetical protein